MSTLITIIVTFFAGMGAGRLQRCGGGVGRGGDVGVGGRADFGAAGLGRRGLPFRGAVV